MKIFGIGLTKTGINSLVEALNLTGFKLVRFPSVDQLETMDQFDGCADLPAIVLYRKLDLAFPGSKFILTIRDKEKWLESVTKHFKRRPPSTLNDWAKANRIKVFGSLYPSRADFSQVYDDWHSEIAEYFSDRPQDLLELNIADAEDGAVTWQKLAAFLDVDTPKGPFPHRNAKPGKTEVIDAVIPYCRQGDWDSLLYVVRALSENFVDLGRLWVVGDKPEWASSELRHIEHIVKWEPDCRLRNSNYCKSMFMAGMHPEISEEFLYLADDHYILVPRTAQEIRDTAFVQGDLAKVSQVNRKSDRRLWQKLLWNTADRLLDLGYSAWNYETHTPKMVNRTKLVSCLAFFGYGDGNLMWQTAYFNRMPSNAGIRAHVSGRSPLKAGFYQEVEENELIEKSDAAIYLNHGGPGETKAVQKYIEKRFSTPSRFEKQVRRPVKA